MSSWHTSRSESCLEFQEDEEEESEAEAKQIDLDDFSLRRAHVCRRRWLILFLASLLCACGSASSGTSLTDSAGSLSGQVAIGAYGVESEPMLMAGMQVLALSLVALPAAIIIAKRGFRCVVLTSISLLMLSCACRVRFCSRDSSPDTFILGSVCAAAINDIGQVAMQMAPVIVAHSWFRETERILATAIAMGSICLGSGLSYFISLGYLYKAPTNATLLSANKDKRAMLSENKIDLNLADLVHFVANRSSLHNDTLMEALDVAQDRKHLETLFVFHYVCSLTLLIATMIWFPSKPSYAPDQNVDKIVSNPTDLIVTAKMLLTNWWMWIASLSFAVPSAMVLTFQELLANDTTALNLQPQDFAISSLTSAFAAVFLAFLLDRSRARSTFALLHICSGICYLWLSLVSFEMVPNSGAAAVRAAYMVGAGASFVSAPLALEIICGGVCGNIHRSISVASVLTGKSLLALLCLISVYFSPDLSLAMGGVGATLSGMSFLAAATMLIVRENI